MKKKLTILFNGAHLSYSPTVIGLYDLLAKHFEVTILADSPKNFDNQPLPGRNVVYKEIPPNIFKLLFYLLVFNLRAMFDKKIPIPKKMRFAPRTVYDFEAVRQHLDRENPDFIIAVDFKNLYFAQILDRKVEFLSLEIIPGDEFYRNCDFNNVKSVIVQTAERYRHLFDGREFRTFFVQNAPVFDGNANGSIRKNLIYCGTAWNPFGFYHCLNFLRKFPEYTLHVKGALLADDKLKTAKDYGDLSADGRLIFDSEYLDDGEVVKYLRGFRIGFCFYNFELKWINNFNYRSAPSGKMFKYFAAGVPVIGQNILGLQPVKEFDCGVLIEDLEPATIKKSG